MPTAGARVTLATSLGPVDALVVASVEDEVIVLSNGCGLHAGASASTRVCERHELASRYARIGLALGARVLVGEERALPRVACRLAATTRRAGDAAVSSWASVLDVSQGGLALRADAAYGAGDLIDIDLDDGTGAVISARVEIVEQTADEAGGIARGRVIAIGEDGAQRLGALVDRLRDSPSDGEPQPEPLPALREALANARRPRVS
jgi:hypothetical protein